MCLIEYVTHQIIMALNWNAMVEARSNHLMSTFSMWLVNSNVVSTNQMSCFTPCFTNRTRSFWKNRITILENSSNKDIKTYLSVYTINWALSIEMEPRIRRSKKKHASKKGAIYDINLIVSNRCALAPFRL